MAKSERNVRKTKDALSTPAARPARERVLSKGPDGGNRGPSQAAAMAGYASSVPSALGGMTTPGPTGEVGAPGNLNVFGFLTGEDYNKDLDGFPMFANYNRMRLGDAQVNATLLMMKLPLKGARWVATPGSDDPQDVAIADFVQANLIDDDSLARSWQHVLDNAMLKFDFGCAGAEVIWGNSAGVEAEARLMRAHPRVLAMTKRPRRGWDLSHEQGKQGFFHALDRTLSDMEAATGPVYAKVDDLAPRLPRTFYRWVEDPTTGKLSYLQQFAPKNGQYGFWNIQAENLALHVRAREGNNYYGRSVLRTAYPHWWWKQQLYRIDMIGHDRFHVGIPRASLDKDYSANTAPLDKIEETLKGLRSHDRAYMVQPFGVAYDIYGSKTGGTATSGIISSIEHHNVMIARNILQSFSTQGEQRHGSFGAAKIGTDVYFDALQGEANEIGSELKQAVVKRLCDLNFNMKGRKYPSIVATDISAVDFSQLATALAALATAGMITPDDDLESWLREVVDAPGLPDALKGLPRKTAATSVTAAPATPTPPAAPQPEHAKQDPPAGAIAAAKRSRYQEGGRVFSRPPNPFERKVLDLHGIPSTLDNARASLVKEMASIRRQQLATAAKRIAQKDGRDTAAFTDIRHVHIKMPGVDRMTKAIRTAQTTTLAYGQQTVRDELERQGARLPAEKRLAGETAGSNRNTARSTLVSSASITATKQANAWQSRILDTGLRIRRTGVQGDELEARIQADLEDEIESGAKRDASSEVHESFGVGRELAASELEDLIEKATYSCLLDAASCDPCIDLDGEEFDVDSDEYEANLPPNVNCDGRDECRCLYLYTAVAPKDE